MLVESREGLLELELASLPATTAFAARPLVVEVLDFLLERSEGAHFLNHLVCVGLQLALLLAQTWTLPLTPQFRPKSSHRLQCCRRAA